MYKYCYICWFVFLSQSVAQVSGVLTVKACVMNTVKGTPVMMKLVTVSVNLVTMALKAIVIHAAVDVPTHVMLSRVHATVGLGGMDTNVTLEKSVSQSVNYVSFLI